MEDTSDNDIFPGLVLVYESFPVRLFNSPLEFTSTRFKGSRL
jgi:hypothetical protein